MRLPVNHGLALAALIALSGCLPGLGGGKHRAAPQLPAQRSGPAADYPVVIGDPFVIEGVTHTPADRLNYDEVGYAIAGGEGGDAISAASRTLPLPSYVEVTSLVSGRTILVRVERRGPMRNDRLIELSPGAARQLGMPEGEGGDKSPVRVRRVNPPEAERALLRAGQPAAPRMDTPRPLLGVLLRKLEPSLATGGQPDPAPAASPSPPAQPAATKPAATKPPRRKPAPAAAPSAPAGPGALVIQAAAFSTRERAENAAAALGGAVVQAGRLWRVRVGPFSSRAEADAALAKVRAQGYSDARIQHAD